ncbi:unnamed protein product [Candidula unifasciata]|uniref:Uncharacterized protein n=1 Tax=Candidula unifasciata TaxID=100452 RepID=A0A8S3ZX05_9EUPU|nr:unnamed protein product [Candidula unifasciata]
MAMMRKKGKYLLGGLVFVFLCWFLVNWQNSLNLLPSQVEDSSLDVSVREVTTVPPKIRREHSSSENRKCPSLSGMTEGRWVVRPLNETEQMMIDTYLKEARGAYKIPPTFQREDGRCGDVTYSNVTLHKHMWFRAICDPRGATPCCHTNSCQLLAQEDCRCPTCLDERQAVHAEFAHWQPTDDRCPVMEFNADRACQLLEGMSLYFVGDSFIRHMFAALVIILTNEVNGAMKEDIPRDIKGRCLGHNQITAEVCRAYLDPDRVLCHGKVKVQYVEMFSVADLPVIHQLLVDLRQSGSSLVVLGLGIHDNFNPTVVSKKFLHPFLNLRQHLSTNISSAFLQTDPAPGLDLTRLRPGILWVGAHAPGLLKSPRFPQQSADGVQHYNSEISHVLKRWGVPVLDTFSFSNGTVSFDGTHYGWGINKLKANMLMTYIRTSFWGDGRK